MYVCVHTHTQSTTSSSLWPHGLEPARVLCQWNFPDKNTGMGCYFLLQRIFLSQEIKPASCASSALAGRFFMTEPRGKPKIWRCRGLNPGPHTCKACALPLSYIPWPAFGMVNFNMVNTARNHAAYTNPSSYPTVGFSGSQEFLNFSSEIKQKKMPRIFRLQTLLLLQTHFRLSCYLPRLPVIAICFFLVVVLILIHFNILNIIKL